MTFLEAIVSLKNDIRWDEIIKEIKARRENAMQGLVVAKPDTFQQYQGGYMAMDSLLHSIETADQVVKLVAENAKNPRARD